MNNFEQLKEMAENPEPLHEDLVPWVEQSETFGPILKHPLVYSIGVGAEGPLSTLANKQYEYKRKAVQEAQQEGNWNSFVFLHERPWRLDAFDAIKDAIERDEEYWDLLGGIWTDSENIWQNEQAWIEDLEADRMWRGELMDQEERDALLNLPQRIEIFRGFARDDRQIGLSWTTDLERAKFFAKRLNMDDDVPRVAVATIVRAEVIAHFLGRGEAEIVTLPDRIQLEEVKYVR